MINILLTPTIHLLRDLKPHLCRTLLTWTKTKSALWYECSFFMLLVSKNLPTRLLARTASLKDTTDIQSFRGLPTAGTSPFAVVMQPWVRTSPLPNPKRKSAISVGLLKSRNQIFIMATFLIVLAGQGGAFADNSTDGRDCVNQCDVTTNCVSVTVPFKPRNRDGKL